MVTPDDDVYEEELAIPPLTGFKVSPGGGRLPQGLGARHNQPVYRFRRLPSDRAFHDLVARAEALAARAPPAAAALLPGPAAAPALAPVVGAPPLAADEVWLGLSPEHLGEELDPQKVDGGTWRGDLVLGQLDDGSWVPAKRVKLHEKDQTINTWRAAVAAVTPRGQGGALVPPRVAPAAPAAGPESPDARTLAVLRNTTGERFRSVQSLSESMAQEKFEDWPLQGPHTTCWWVKQVSRTGTGFVARHHTWRHENNVPEDSKNCMVHEVVCEALELLGCVDQYDLSNSAGAESLVRHAQFAEHEVKKRADAKKEHDGSEYFLGRTKRTGGALISPDLLKWVSEQAAKDSAILKETRKAVEERALARAPKK